MSTNAQRGARSQKKGKDFQKEVCALIAKHLGVPEEEVYCCMGGKTERDIQMSERVARLFPFHPECKNFKNWGSAHLASWTKQAEKDAAAEGLGLHPLVVYKLHGDTTPRISMTLAEFLLWVA